MVKGLHGYKVCSEFIRINLLYFNYKTIINKNIWFKVQNFHFLILKCPWSLILKVMYFFLKFYSYLLLTVILETFCHDFLLVPWYFPYICFRILIKHLYLVYLYILLYCLYIYAAPSFSFLTPKSPDPFSPSLLSFLWRFHFLSIFTVYLCW